MTDPNRTNDNTENSAPTGEPVVSKPYIMPDDPEAGSAEALSKELAEARDRTLRTLAEMENLRQRTRREVALRDEVHVRAIFRGAHYAEHVRPVGVFAAIVDRQVTERARGEVVAIQILARVFTPDTGFFFPLSFGFGGRFRAGVGFLRQRRFAREIHERAVRRGRPEPCWLGVADVFGGFTA